MAAGEAVGGVGVDAGVPTLGGVLRAVTGVGVEVPLAGAEDCPPPLGLAASDIVVLKRKMTGSGFVHRQLLKNQRLFRTFRELFSISQKQIFQNSDQFLKNNALRSPATGKINRLILCWKICELATTSLITFYVVTTLGHLLQKKKKRSPVRISRTCIRIQDLHQNSRTF